MKVLVLGANGFIGARLVGRLIEAGHEVRVRTVCWTVAKWFLIVQVRYMMFR
jgi:nucleoside-diphosphate-sugar epimerase